MSTAQPELKLISNSPYKIYRAASECLQSLRLVDCFLFDGNSCRHCTEPNTSGTRELRLADRLPVSRETGRERERVQTERDYEREKVKIRDDEAYGVPHREAARGCVVYARTGRQ